jgi:hypothetical protein
MEPSETPLLPALARPEPFWQCPHCLAPFALRFVRNESRIKKDDVRVFCCAKCGRETEYLARRPNHVL